MHLPLQNIETTGSIKQPAVVDQTRIRLILIACFAVCLIVGLVETWAFRFVMDNPDGVSYLDLADSMLARDWSQAISPYFGFLYSALLSIALLCLHPAPVSEPIIAHLTHFFTFFLSLLAFTYFILEFRLFYAARCRPECFPVSDWFTVVSGFVLFFWASFDLSKIDRLTPDFLVSTSVYLAGALLLKVYRVRCGVGTYAMLGLVLGLGSLAKTVMFPIAFLFFALSAFGQRRNKAAVVAVASALSCFTLITAPYIFEISRQHGSFSFGESGRCAYIWSVEGIPIAHWRGDPAIGCNLVHPTTQIVAQPATFEFSKPFKATYAPWFNPACWYQGTQIRIEPKGQLVACLSACKTYIGFFFYDGAPLTFLLVALFLLRVNEFRWRNAFLSVVCGAALSMYLAVGYVEGRYIAPFFVLGWMSILSGCYFEKSTPSFQKTLIALIVPTILLMSWRFDQDGEMRKGLFAPRNVAWQIAQDLQRIGIKSGDKVAFVGPGASECYWARLAGVRITAEVPSSDEFWSVDERDRKLCMRAIADSGATAMITRSLPKNHFNDEWVPLGPPGITWGLQQDKAWFIYLLR